MIKQLKDLFDAYSKITWLPESIKNQVIFYLFLTGILITMLNYMRNIIQKIMLLHNQKLLNKDLHPYYSNSDVVSCTKYYISTKYQNISPSEDEEPGRLYIASAKSSLLPLFLKKVFTHSGDNNKYYLILADSGMGKTTLLINLYIQYKNQWRLPFTLPKYDIRLFPIWHKNTFKDIDSIEDPKNTILLLDAFDEDIEAQKNYKARLSEILENTDKFRAIVITCRTQFFPSQKEEPHETGYFSGGDFGQYKFQKLYLSVFTDKDVSKYLRKRYSLFELAKRRKAKKIAKNCPNLVVRPMLLSYINELIYSNNTYKYSFQIYQALIEQWISRESKKPYVSTRFKNEELFKLTLKKFSQKLAVDLYKKRRERNGFSISKGEEFSEGVLSLADIESVNFTENDGKSRSLLNRNADGNYKFSHKSILEYFLANEFFSDDDFFCSFDFQGMDAANRFYEEMITVEIGKSKGTYKSATQEENPIASIDVKNLNKIELLKLIDFENVSPVLLSGLRNIKEIILLNENKMQLLYKMYFYFYFYSPDLNFLEELNEALGKLRLNNIVERLKLKDRINARAHFNITEAYDLYSIYKKPDNSLNFLKSENLNLENILRKIGKLEIFQRLERMSRSIVFDIQKIPKRIEMLILYNEMKEIDNNRNKNSRDVDRLIYIKNKLISFEGANLKSIEKEVFKLETDLNYINIRLGQIKKLKNNIPKCNVYY